MDSDLPLPSYIVSTGSGGEHWYYGWQQQFGLRTGQRVNTLELIALDGYVVAPGSRHTSGSLYSLKPQDPTREWWNLKPLPEDVSRALVGGARPRLPSTLPHVGSTVSPDTTGCLLTYAYLTKVEADDTFSEDDLLVIARDAYGLGCSISGIPEHILQKAQASLCYPACEEWLVEIGGKIDPAKTASPPKSASILANVEYLDISGAESGRLKFQGVAKPAAIVRKHVIESLNGWPCTAGTGQGILFSVKSDVDPTLPEAIWWMEDPTDMFAWFHDVFGDVCWVEGTGIASPSDQTPRSYVTKSEFFRLLQQYPGARYDEVCNLPHYPPLSNVLYLAPELPPPDPTLPVWTEFVGLFNPETEQDRILLAAAMLTPLWGGVAGTRPAFLITSKHGRGVGKTCTVEAIAEAYGGAITHKPGPGKRDITDALISPEGMSKRVVVWDNLKGKQDCAIVESMITARSIQGHRLYVGHTGRINNLTWFLTSNRPETSSDLAQRAIPIEIGPHKHSVDFPTRVAEFLRVNKIKLLSEMAYILSPNYPIAWNLTNKDADRWQAWMRAILCKLPGGEACLPMIRRRRKEMDTDIDESEMVVEWIMQLMSDKNRASRSMELGRFTFPTHELFEIAKKAGFSKMSAIDFGRWLMRKIADGDLGHLRRARAISPDGTRSRGFMFEPGPVKMRELIMGRRRDQKEGE